MKKILLLILSILLLQELPAQVTDDTNGWLYRLCKTWGYVKYFNQNKCGVAWDEMLNNSINEVLLAKSNTDCNSFILNFLNRAGNNQPVGNPPSLPDTNLLVHTLWIDDPIFDSQVRNFLKQFRSNIYPDQSLCLANINYSGGSYINFSGDPFTLSIDYTIESHRLTVFFYYWNIINYFFPYRNLMDQSWDSTLLEFIPIFRKSKSEMEFHNQFLKLVTRIQDSHGFTQSPLITSNFWKGSYLPLIFFERIEGQCINRKNGGNVEIEPGDILTAVDGIDIRSIEDSLALYNPASTPAALYRDIYRNMLRGSLNSIIILTFKNRNGQIYSVSERRLVDLSTWSDWSKSNSQPESYKITACGYGYVDMGKLLTSEIPDMYNSLQKAPAIIFDLRNYPNGTLWSLAPYFFKTSIVSAVYYTPALNSPQVANLGQYLPGWYFQKDNSNLGPWNNPSPYSGRIYILVNQVTQSQAEYTCQYLSYHPNAKVLGTQTAGADGNISTVGLPGEIWTCFTSLGWYYADGYQQQRNGVKIDSVVAPTIQGIREGKDEILLAALDCISGIDKPVPQNLPVNVYPNPVITGSVKVSISLDRDSEITFSVMDLTGKIMMREVQYCPAGDQTLELDLNVIAPGLYILETRSRLNTAITKLVIR